MSYTDIMTVMVVGAPFGMILWGGYFYWNKRSPLSFHQLFITLLVVGILLRIAFSFLTPTFYAPDEIAHHKYIEHLTENRTFPVRKHAVSASLDYDWEFSHPPLYYLSTVPLYWIVTKVFEGDQDTVVRVVRLFSIVLWLINVMFVYKILNNLKVENFFIRIFAISMVCLLPTYTYLSSVINNDNLLITLGGFFLYLMTRKQTPGTLISIGVVLGLALLTKLSAIIYLVIAIGVFFLKFIRVPSTRVQTLGQLFLVLAIPAIMFVPWTLRNLSLYDSILPVTTFLGQPEWPSLYHAFRTILVNVRQSFWAVSGIVNGVKFFPEFGTHLTYFSILGLLYGFILKREQLYQCISKHTNFYIATGFAVVVNVILLFRYGMVYGYGQGRYLFPTLIPISIFMAIGIRFLLGNYSQRFHVHVVAFFINYAYLFTIFSLSRFRLE